MVQPHGGDTSEEDQRTDATLPRRSFLSTLGAAGGAIALGGLAAASAGEDVVDLGEEGLSEGDEIDPYFEEHFRDGVEVHVPEGSYDWNGGGWGQVADASLIGDGEVELHRPDEMNPRLEATGGTVIVRNLTIRGEAGDNESSIRLGAHDEDALLLVENVDQPDGAVDPSFATGIYVPPAHAGVLVLRDCHVEGFADNGLYASTPGGHPEYDYQDGAVIVDGGLYRNNNISNVRIGSSDSLVQNATIVNDEPSPTAGNGSQRQRGLRIRQDGQNIRVVNCDIVQREPPWAVSIHEGASGGSGVIEDTRIHHDGDDPAIRCQDGYDGDWVARNVQFTGEGNLDSMIPTEDCCTGDDCQSPDDSRHEPVEDGSELVLSGAETEDYDYAVTTTGRIVPRFAAEERATDADGEHVAAQNPDGTWTAEGAVPAGSEHGDTLAFEGSVADLAVSCDPADVRAELDGEEIAAQELVAGSAGETADESEAGSDGAAGSGGDSAEGSDGDGAAGSSDDAAGDDGGSGTDFDSLPWF